MGKNKTEYLSACFMDDTYTITAVLNFLVINNPEQWVFSIFHTFYYVPYATNSYGIGAKNCGSLPSVVTT